MDFKKYVRLEHTLTATLKRYSMFVIRITVTLKDDSFSCKQIKVVLILSKFVLHLSLIVKITKSQKSLKCCQKNNINYNINE